MTSFVTLCVLVLCVLASPTEGIFNGEPATIVEFPWHAGVAWQSMYFCGATLIGPTSAVTSAACIYSNTHFFTLKAGTTDKELYCKTATCQETLNLKIFKHPGYTSHMENNIAVLKWDSPILERDGEYKVKYLERATSEVKVGTKCKIQGWGYTHQTPGAGNAPKTMKQGHVSIVSHEECAKHYDFLNENHICARDPENKTSSCKFDQGSSLSCEDKDGNIKLVGVDVGVPKDCDPTKPHVYAKVSNYKQWIDQTVASH